jgi:hypothetical protein
MRFVTLSIAAAMSLSLAGAAWAATQTFTATMSGANEVPANASKGTGEVKATLDTVTKVFEYSATYSGLTGPAIAAHFHGPAMAGANAGPALPIPAAAIAASPITGKATLTDAQIADLQAGRWYLNIHTAANGGGEIRGQLKMAP